MDFTTRKSRKRRSKSIGHTYILLQTNAQYVLGTRTSYKSASDLKNVRFFYCGTALTRALSSMKSVFVFNIHWLWRVTDIISIYISSGSYWSWGREEEWSGKGLVYFSITSRQQLWSYWDTKKGERDLYSRFPRFSTRDLYFGRYFY